MNRSLIHTLLFGTVASLALAACQPESATPASGTQPTPEATAAGTSEPTTAATPRLAVYDLGSLDIIQALGGQAAIVPDGIGPAYLQPASQAAPARGGSLFEPDAGLLAALAPDLIILGRRSAGHQEALSAIGRTINLATRPDHFLQDVQANTLRLGELLDQGPRAQALVDELQDSLEELHGLSAGQTALILFTVGNGANVQAPGARHGMLHEVSGLAPVIGAIAAGSDERGTRPEPGSPEALARRQANQELLLAALAQEPDWLIVLDRTGATGDEAIGTQILAGIPEVAATQAWQAGRVLHLDAPTWYLATGGIQGVQRTVHDMIQALRQAQ